MNQRSDLRNHMKKDHTIEVSNMILTPPTCLKKWKWSTGPCMIGNTLVVRSDITVVFPHVIPQITPIEFKFKWTMCDRQ